MKRTVFSFPGNIKDRPHQWGDVLSEVYCRLDLESRPENFSGLIRQTIFADLELSRAATTVENVRRANRHISKDVNDGFVFFIARNSSVWISQLGRDSWICKNGFGLLDVTMPYRLRHDTPADIIALKIPEKNLRSRVPNLEQYCARENVTADSMLKIVENLMCTLDNDVSSLSEQQSHQLSVNIVDIICLVIDSAGYDMPASDSHVKNALLRRSMAYIDANIADPNLNPEMISNALGISVRYLHRIFSETGDTVGRYIRERRLVLAKQLMSDARFSDMPISEIALRRGFRNHSHFSRIFQERFKMKPRASRKSE